MLAEELTIEFRRSPECNTVQFDAMRGGDESSRSLERKLESNPNSVYWRLRVDLRPGLPQQPYELGPGVERARVEGDDAEHTVPFMCNAVKNNGVVSAW